MPSDEKTTITPPRISKPLIWSTAAILIVLVGTGAYWLSTRKTALNPSQNTAALAASHGSEIVKLVNGQSYNLTAGFVKNDLGGTVQKMLAYNGSIPGPIFRVTQGDTVTVNFENEIAMDTTVHAHGLRQDVKMDGTPITSQDPVKVGGSFQYKWSFPDPGVYWYHPHIREDFQQGSGLYGAIVVEPKSSGYWPAADAEQTLILSDALTDASTGLLAPFYKEGADHTMMGRYGNLLLVNGVANWQTKVQAGTVQRLYLANASDARPYRFALDGAKLKLIGSDNGRVGNERMVDALTLSPGERYVVDVTFPKTGAVAIKNNAPGAYATLGAFMVTEPSQPTQAHQSYSLLRTNSDVLDQIKALAAKVTSSKRLALTITMNMGDSNGMGDMGGMNHMGGSSSGTHTMSDGMMMDSAGNSVDPETTGIEWSDTGSMTGDAKWQITDQDSGKVNDAVKWAFKKGDVVRITINNDANSMHPMQHPIHIHGQRFAVVSQNGTPNSNYDWKDTVTIPSGQTYELLVDMENPGEWMLHCHIGEHLETGMMINFKVEN